MKIVAIDSSGLVASVAVAEDDILLAEYTIHHKKTHSQTLLPMLDEVVQRIELDLQTVDAIAVASGPGSFTGLRIGSSTAKGLGFALDIPIIPVPTLEGMAYQLWNVGGYICPIMDARRNQVYTGVYQFRDFKMHTVKEGCAIGIDELISYLNDKDMQVTFLGDGVPVFSEYIKTHCTLPYRFAPVHANRQSAAALVSLAFVYAKEGKTETSAMYRPSYFRLSQAERERLEKETP